MAGARPLALPLSCTFHASIDHQTQKTVDAVVAATERQSFACIVFLRSIFRTSITTNKYSGNNRILSAGPIIIIAIHRHRRKVEKQIYFTIRDQNNTVCRRMQSFDTATCL